MSTFRGADHTLQQWEKSHKTQEAINAYSKVIKRHKDYLLPILRRGAMYSLSHEYKSAISDFDEVIRNAPRSGGVYFLRGRAYEELKQLEPALADYEKALEFDPGRFVYRLRRAVTYEALKKFDLALSEYDALRYYEYSEILHTKLQNYPAALVSKIRSYLVSLKEIPETRDTAFLWLRVVSLFFLLPFFMAAVVSTSEKRKFFDLFKIKNIVKLGWECYQRAFFVTFWWLIFGLGFLETSKFFGNRLVMLNGPVFVIGLFIGFHLIAQSFRSEKDALTATDVPTLDDPS